ncbi:BamA/TamA family outer membrane protein [Paraflavisolibacter sp. H34]|uniref:BamA/TamA family outer membrane protein n=1 Tax=Huijunlia imazamoxiresistens TaxID=3127457 RepID=UPI00301B5B38
MFAVLLLLLSSCTIVKNYPVRRPFVYEVNINVKGKFNTDERKQLVNQLQQQLHDSLQLNKVEKLVGWRKYPRFFYTELVKPPVWDSAHATRSVIFLHALLNSLGYYRDTITYDTSLRVRGDQHRVTLNFNTIPGRLIKLDSVAYRLGRDTLVLAASGDTVLQIFGDDSLQKVTDAAMADALLKRGEPFAKGLISTELNRLTDVYRNSGYLRFSREDLVAVWDTVGLALLRPTLDPFEQANQLQELQRRRENPTADLEVRLRPDADSVHLVRYHVGNVTVYPDWSLDSAFYQPTVTYKNGYKIVSNRNLFTPGTLTENIYLRRGARYSQRRYLQTLSRFNSLQAWRLANIEQVPRPGTDSVDFVIKLTPARKYLFTSNLEGSRNWNDFINSGNLLGLGVNLSLQNRNFARRANQAASNFRYGIELNASDELIQSQQVTVGHTFNFPRLVPELPFIPDRLKDNFNTVFAFNVNNYDRVRFLNLTSFNTSWGYKFNWRNKLLEIRLPNIEYSFLNRREDLEKLIAENASYNFIFNNGLITSALASYTLTHARKVTTSLARFNWEMSGLLPGLVKTDFLENNLYRFIKVDAEYRKTHKLTPRTEFAWRAFGGAGYELPSSRHRFNRYLPFFRSYFAGGANSMRAWGLRKLGPGSAIKSFDRQIAPDRFGDIQLEANGEYRFYLTEISGVRLNGALFTDIGNVWFLRENPDFPGGAFRLNKLWKDLAIGSGTGLRVDFGFFLIRLDYAYKVKDPSPGDAATQNKWFYHWNWLNGQLQLGVNLPF